jgi:hypothetical protein
MIFTVSASNLSERLEFQTNIKHKILSPLASPWVLPVDTWFAAQVKLTTVDKTRFLFSRKRKWPCLFIKEMYTAFITPVF